MRELPDRITPCLIAEIVDLARIQPTDCVNGDEETRILSLNAPEMIELESFITV